MNRHRRFVPDDERSDVRSDDGGRITFNHQQQSERDDSVSGPEAPTTDPWGITDGAVGS